MKKKIFFAVIAVALLAINFFPEMTPAALAIAPIGGFSMQDLEKYAGQHLSSFDGEDFEGDDIEGDFEGDFEGDDFEGDMYTGAYDDFVDFGGFNKSFATAGDSGRIFVMTITNANAAARTANLVPGYLWANGVANSGAVVEGAFNDASGAAGLSAVGSPKTCNEFQAFVQQAPVAIGGIKIESTVATQMSGQLVIEHLSPFKTLEQKIINLGSYQNENTFRDKIVTIPTPDLVISAQTKITLVIQPSSTCIVTFLAGAILNPTHAMQQKLTRAKATISRVGLAPLKRMQMAAGTRRPMLRGRGR